MNEQVRRIQDTLERVPGVNEVDIGGEREEIVQILLLTIAWREAVVAGLSVPITFAGVLLAILVMGYSLSELVVIGMIIFGLVSVSMLALIVVPALYLLLTPKNAGQPVSLD